MATGCPRSVCVYHVFLCHYCISVFDCFLHASSLARLQGNLFLFIQFPCTYFRITLEGISSNVSQTSPWIKDEPITLKVKGQSHRDLKERLKNHMDVNAAHAEDAFLN